jgi:hypothetical protein
MKQAPDARGRLTDLEIQTVRNLIEVHGETVACQRLEVSRSTMARVIARLPVYRGTIMIVRAALQRIQGVAHGGPK